MTTTTTTYYYSSGSEAGSYWTNDSYAFNNNNGNYADRDVPKNSGKETTKWIKGTSNNAPSSGDNIIKVEIGFRGYVENTWLKIFAVPVFNGTTDGDEYVLGATTSAAQHFVDITHDDNAPFSWSWSTIQNLDVKIYCKNTDWWDAYEAYISHFYVKVTSSTGPGISSKQLHYALEGENSNIDSDNFNDNSLDSTCWTSYTYDSGAINEQNQRLELSETSGGDAAIYQTSVSGDFDVSVKIINSDYPDNYGIFFGDYMSDRYIQCYVYSVNSNHYIEGYIEDGSGSGSSTNTAPSLPFWMRIKRVGSTGYVYYSSNGTSWTLLFSRSTYNTENDIYIYLNHFQNSDSHYAYFDDFVNREVVSTTDIDIYTSKCGTDGTTCMNYALAVCVDGTNVNYCQLSTTLTHTDMSKLRVRKGSVTYGVLKEFDENA